MFVLHLALGGCLKAPPIHFGITADTGGHIAYVLEAARAQAAHRLVSQVSIVTRLFDDDQLGGAHALRCEPLGPGLSIDRIATARRDYLEKEALADDLPAFGDAFRRHLASLPRLPDVIHAHFADAAEVARHMRARFGIPFLYTPHALGLDKRRLAGSDPALDSRIAAERRAIQHADAIIVSSPDEGARQLPAYGVADAAARTLCIPPGVPGLAPAEAAPACRVLRSAGLHDPDRPIVLAIARPVRKKNLAALARAFAASPALRGRANLVILAGQQGVRHARQEERAVLAELSALAASSCLRGRMALPPCHDAADVASLYRRASLGGVFVNPALHEPFGLTLIEAASAGVPVVATRHGGPADIVGALRNGLLVDPLDQEAIAAACLRIIADPRLHRRLAGSGRRHVARYDWTDHAERSVGLYALVGRGAANGAAPAPASALRPGRRIVPASLGPVPATGPVAA